MLYDQLSKGLELKTMYRDIYFIRLSVEYYRPIRSIVSLKYQHIGDVHLPTCPK